MHRRRSALSVSAAAALLLGVPLLSGCGGAEGRPGAAAVVDGEEIPVAAVQARAEAVRDAQRADPEGEQLIQSTGPVQRYMLNYLLVERVVEQAAQDAGVSVSRAEVQEYRAAEEKRFRGGEALETVMLRERAIAPDQIDNALRVELLVRKTAEALGGDVERVFAETAADLGIDVSPRYGTWNAEQVTLAGATDPWIKPATVPQEPF
ncbi:SurA N-terminal domain-containing protein [Streptomyces sp. JJ66]|uniref:SurA N-terminal domain-containing protein n=1 Tax=Streptomyces sp. JJ66 TaxID=2803843 RepID=UPI001C582E22|nr:SurA N-terminal domain-containing protein [Streptomyces sp. JJ66]MBW1602750.1 SurA N-terminal domain-containing protein [Streptomyces sp. JJ66]